MFVLAVITGLFMFDNQEYFGTVEDQVNAGYSWEYVGKSEPSGKPALVAKDGQDNDVIYFRLTK